MGLPPHPHLHSSGRPGQIPVGVVLVQRKIKWFLFSEAYAPYIADRPDHFVMQINIKGFFFYLSHEITMFRHDMWCCCDFY